MIYTELSNTIKELKINTAPALDNLTDEMLKAREPIIIHVLLKLLNSILSRGKFLKTWGKGVITSLHKKGIK